MTIREDVLRLLRSTPEGMTDAELARRLGKLHQQVNQRCRQLATEGLLVRDSSASPIVNRLQHGVAAPPDPPPLAVSPAHEMPSPQPLATAQVEWSWEGNVQSAIVAHLAREGWRVTRVADTAAQERGVDVVAERETETVLVEVKGWPSRVYARGERAGQPKPTQPTLQAKHWYAEALLSALRLREKHARHCVVMAFPDMPRYRAVGSETATSLRACGVDIWFVTADGNVTAGSAEQGEPT